MNGRFMVFIAAFGLCVTLALAAHGIMDADDDIIIPELAKSTPAPAQAVFVTPSGSKYHRESCASISNSEDIEQYTPDAAREAGYEACKRCAP